MRELMFLDCRYCPRIRLQAFQSLQASLPRLLIDSDHAVDSDRSSSSSSDDEELSDAAIEEYKYGFHFIRLQSSSESDGEGSTAESVEDRGGGGSSSAPGNR